MIPALRVEGGRVAGCASPGEMDGMRAMPDGEYVRVKDLGFRWEMVDALKYQGVGYDEGHDQDKLDMIADLLESLLPPRAP